MMGKRTVGAVRAIILFAVSVSCALAYAAGVTIHRTFSTGVALGEDIAWTGFSFRGTDSATFLEVSLILSPLTPTSSPSPPAPEQALSCSAAWRVGRNDRLVEFDC